ncbi:hypothetical protein DID80_05770 [Candidatus Marinamargulisbacteria bacterium SCGC AAA071-K20]|nr:hypothetical protein DID80_05770 [Candidatus Marinamargulisbacteria bacterium SCGC AAA071-K20]
MQIIIFRAEKEKIHFMECDVKEGVVIVGEKGKVSLEPAKSSGEKYQLIMDGLTQLLKKMSPSKLVYRSGLGFRGNIDEIRYTNEAMLSYFSYSNQIEIEELTQSGVRKKLGLKTPEFKALIEKETTALRAAHGLTKSDKILETLVFLSLLSAK